MKPSGCCCPIERHEHPALRIPRLAHLADQQVELVAALGRQPGAADLGQAPPQARRAGAVPPQLDDRDARVARALDPVAQLHPLRPREREASPARGRRSIRRRRRGTRGCGTAPRRARAPAAPPPARRRARCRAGTRPAARRGCASGACTPPGTSRCRPWRRKGTKPASAGHREAQVARRQRQEARRVIDVLDQRAQRRAIGRAASAATATRSSGGLQGAVLDGRMRLERERRRLETVAEDPAVARQVERYREHRPLQPAADERPQRGHRGGGQEVVRDVVEVVIDRRDAAPRRRGGRRARPAGSR